MHETPQPSYGTLLQKGQGFFQRVTKTSLHYAQLSIHLSVTGKRLLAFCVVFVLWLLTPINRKTLEQIPSSLFRVTLRTRRYHRKENVDVVMSWSWGATIFAHCRVLSLCDCIFNLENYWGHAHWALPKSPVWNVYAIFGPSQTITGNCLGGSARQFSGNISGSGSV